MSEPVSAVPAVPFDYTNRDYLSLRASLIDQVRSRIPGWTGYTDPSDFGLALIEMVAYVADGLHYYLDRIVNEAYVLTATRPESVQHAARLVGYRPSRASSASVTLTFTNDSTEDVVIPYGTRVQTALVSDVTMAPIYFETLGEIGGTAVGLGEIIDVVAVEGVTYDGDDGTGEVQGVSNGYGWQTYTLPRSPIIHGFVNVTVAYSDSWQETWTQVEDIRAAAAAAKVYQVESFPGQPVRIRFGNGTSGLIPPLGSVIKATYRVGGGTLGNVAPNTVTVISDDVSLIGVTVTNLEWGTGGAEAESLDSIRRNILLPAVSSAERAVALPDFERIALTHTSIGKAKAYAPGEADIRVAIGPVDDGTLRPGATNAPDDLNTTTMSTAFAETLTSVETALSDAAFAGAQVTCIAPVYVQVYVQIEITTTTAITQVSQNDLVQRIKTAFSYEEVDFEQKVTAFQVQRLYSSIAGVQNVRVTQLTTSAPDTVGWSTAVENISLQVYEIPWIDTSSTDLVTFVTG